MFLWWYSASQPEQISVVTHTTLQTQHLIRVHIVCISSSILFFILFYFFLFYFFFHINRLLNGSYLNLRTRLCTDISRAQHFLHYRMIFGGGLPPPNLLIWVNGSFKNTSLISSRSFITCGRKPENPVKNHLTIRKQNLAFPHVTRARLEPQLWET